MFISRLWDDLKAIFTDSAKSHSCWFLVKSWLLDYVLCLWKWWWQL